jgi:hypothetical protein
MIKKLLPFAGAIVATLAFIYAGGGLPGGLRLQASNGNSGNAPAATAGAHDHGDGTTTVAAPVALVPPPGGSRVLVTTAAASKPELGYTLAVKVTSPAGMPVNDATIRFFDVVDLFGPKEELIGTGTTDGQGEVAIVYLPATTGTHQIVARFAGRDALVPSLGVTDLEATVAAPAYKVDPSAFAAFSRYIPYGAGVLVLAVWGLIAFSLFGTARGVVASANPSHRKGDTA